MVPFDRSLSSASFWLNQTALGQHTLNVTVESRTYYHGSPYNNTHILSSIASSSGPVYEYPIIVSDIIYFNVSEKPITTIIPSSAPTAPEFPTALTAAFLIMMTAVFAVVIKRKNKLRGRL